MPALASGAQVDVAVSGAPGSVSYTIAADGRLAVLQAAVPTDMQPLDMDTTVNGRFLYVIDGRSDTIRGFAINADGTLSDLGVQVPVAPAAVGMAAD